MKFTTSVCRSIGYMLNKLIYFRLLLIGNVDDYLRISELKLIFLLQIQLNWS